MPRNVKTAAASGKAALPQLSQKMLEELIAGPVTKEQFEDIFKNCCRRPKTEPLLLHDGFGMWCAARRLNQGGFEWPRGGADMATSITLTKQQFDALVLGLPWSRLEQMQSITRV